MRTRGLRLPKALAEEIPIAKACGIVPMALGGPNRIFDIAIVSKIPVVVARIMFAPAILTTIQQFADDLKEEKARLRIVVRYKAVTAGLWLRSRHGITRLFLMTPDSLAGIDRDGKPLHAGADDGETRMSARSLTSIKI